MPLCDTSRVSVTKRARLKRKGQVHHGLSPHEVAAQRYHRETTTYPTWNGGGTASPGLRDKAPGARASTPRGG